MQAVLLRASVCGFHGSDRLQTGTQRYLYTGEIDVNGSRDVAGRGRPPDFHCVAAPSNTVLGVPVI